MQLRFNDTIYKRAIGEIWGYWDGHTCDRDDCTLSEEYLSKAYDNPTPTSDDIDIALDHLIMEADLRNIEEDEEYSEYDDEGRGEVNLLIKGLEELLKNYRLDLTAI